MQQVFSLAEFDQIGVERERERGLSNDFHIISMIFHVLSM